MALEDATNPMQGVSGPSTFSKRTDLEYQSQSYGDGVAYDAAKSGAPLARAPKNPMLSEAPVVRGAGMGAPTGVGLFEPTQRPGEEVTTGVDVGLGAGSSALMMGKSIEKLSDVLVKMLPFDTDGSIAILYQDALSRGN
jgi:hypothetical protein